MAQKREIEPSKINVAWIQETTSTPVSPDPAHASAIAETGKGESLDEFYRVAALPEDKLLEFIRNAQRAARIIQGTRLAALDETDAISIYFAEISGAKGIEDKTLYFNIASRAKSGDAESEDYFMRLHLKLVAYLAMRYTGRGVLYEDLIQAGNWALLKAFDAYNLEYGIKFTTFAWDRIRNTLSKTVAHHRNRPSYFDTEVRAHDNMIEFLTTELGRKPGNMEISTFAFLVNTEFEHNREEGKKRKRSGMYAFAFNRLRLLQPLFDTFEKYRHKYGRIPRDYYICEELLQEAGLEEEFNPGDVVEIVRSYFRYLRFLKTLSGTEQISLEDPVARGTGSITIGDTIPDKDADTEEKGIGLVISAELRKIIKEALADLPENYRLILINKFGIGDQPQRELTREELAKILKLTTNTVDTYASEALNQLREAPKFKAFRKKIKRLEI